MVVFGLILLILAILVIGYVWLATGGMAPVSIDYGILNVELSPLWFFFAGGITLAVATSGLWLMGVGAKASARRAKEVRELRRQAQDADRRTQRGRDRDNLGKGTDHGTGSTTAPAGRGGAVAGGTRGTSAPATTGPTGGPGTSGTPARPDGHVGQTPPSGGTHGQTPPTAGTQGQAPGDGPILPPSGGRPDGPATDPRH